MAQFLEFVEFNPPSNPTVCLNVEHIVGIFPWQTASETGTRIVIVDNNTVYARASYDVIRKVLWRSLVDPFLVVE